MVLPNSFLAKLGLTNVSSPDERHGLTVTVRLAPTKIPAVVVEAMHTVLQSCNSILKEPPPLITIKGLDAEKSFAPLLLDRPEMTEDLAAILATGTSSPVEGGTPGQQHPTSKLALLKAIQTAFRTGPFKRP